MKKNNWPTVKFGDMVHNITDRVDPAETDLEAYVGLEHLDPETLHLKHRLFPKKTHGLIVDYLGIFDDVAQALNTTTKHHHKGVMHQP